MEFRRGVWRGLCGGALLTLACAEGQLVTLGKQPLQTAIKPSGPHLLDAGMTPSQNDTGSPAIVDASLPNDPQDTGIVVTDTGAPPSPAMDADLQDVLFEFEAPVLVEALSSGTKDDNPTLTADLLQIYFSSTRGDSADLWWAFRASAAEDFGEPQLLTELSTSGFDTSPAIEPDGLTLWFARDERDGGADGSDIFMARRDTRDAPWGAPELVPELSSDDDDIPRPTGAGGLVMPMGSRRGGDGYQTFLATREDRASQFSEPQLVTELVEPGRQVVDAFLDESGTLLLYNQTNDDGGDLYVATRESLEQPFVPVQALDTLNTDADERDPWLSPDGSLLFFSSDRSGDLAIYQARRRR